MKNRKLMSVLAVAFLAAFSAAFSAGCSSGGGAGSSSGGSGGPGSGGSGSGGSGSGGSGSGGSGSGGSSGTGGATSAGTGGHASGGSSATGGASSGGATGSGGSGSGGATGSGGTTTTGSGGATSLGGATGSGGKTASGGKGGAATTGGASGGGSSGTAGNSGTQKWVGTWTASPYYDSANAPPTALSNTVIRQIAHVSLGGSQLRVQFSNLQGNGSITISSSHVALCKATGGVVDSTIDTTTDKALAFSGMASVTIGQGKEVWSDAIDFALPVMGNLTITTAFGTVPSQVTSHSGSRTTSYIQSGTNVTAASMTGTGVTNVDHWYAISGIDVMADASAKGVVAIGDSITDGRGTDTNHNNRWTDILVSRLLMNAATMNVSMMNQGIGGTNLAGGAPAAQARFARDVLGQSGAKYVIVFDGVNDIHGGASVDSMKTVYNSFITMAHAKGMVIFGATITPFGGDNTGSDPYYTPAAETTRQQVNTFIKSGVFDGVIDFDAAVTDGGNPPKLQNDLMTWSQMDGLHPGPAGYLKMGNSVDLTLFTK
ncbi:MAG TPA: GDSL-type esterase/lipase family protein [Polyangia bacterium]|jgi:lysophospholipase L1-like esterase